MSTIKTPQYSTMLLSEIYQDFETFDSDRTVTYHFFDVLKQDNAEILFYLLQAHYGNSPIANNDINQFKIKLFSIIFRYGPTWEKRLEIQKSLRLLTDDQISQGSKTIYNHSFNPSSDPSTSALTELETINDQNTTNLKRGKLEGYASLLSLLEMDVTGEFISKFENLFKKFVMPEDPLIYITEGEE